MGRRRINWGDLQPGTTQAEIDDYFDQVQGEPCRCEHGFDPVEYCAVCDEPPEDDLDNGPPRAA